MSYSVGNVVTFQSVTGGHRTGVVADVHEAADHIRVMDVLAPLDGSEWSWSEWVPCSAVECKVRQRDSKST